MIITLDGMSGTGKSTLAKIVASKLNYNYLNTGMIYRAITYYLYSHNVLPEDIDKVEKTLDSLKINIDFKNENQFVYINDDDVSPYVFCKEVQKNVSLYSQIYKLREKVTGIQREFARSNNVVVEGRDIGTYVFPDADCKFFIICDINVRAERRLKDLLAGGQNITLAEVIESLKNRDYIDSTREYSPLKRADDAITIDTSHSTIEESVNEMLKYIEI